MVPQTFSAPDLVTIGLLVVLEALLSADNALVLAIMVRHLPRGLQRKALLYGLGGAFVLRSTAVLLATTIISFWWLQLIGALYLLYLPIKHFHKSASASPTTPRAKHGFWRTVLYLELVDIAFAIDSVIVAVAVVDTVTNPDKLWVVIAGAMIGIVILRFAASFFIRLLERYPVLDHVAYALVGWAGVKLLLISGHTFTVWYEKRNGQTLGWTIPEMPGWLFWGGMAVISIGGTLLALRHRAKDSELHPHDAPSIEDIFSASDEGDSDLTASSDAGSRTTPH